jgi:predicted porin
LTRIRESPINPLTDAVPHKLLASFIPKDDDSATNRDASRWALGYTYALSNRTAFYTAYTCINTKRGATFTVGYNTEAGSGNCNDLFDELIPG